MRALLVDDSRAMRSILRRMVEQIGYQVVEAGHGVEALDVLAATDPFDLALVDWNMPHMSGIELVETVRKDPSLDSMRIVMVTSESDISCMQRALENGADEYVMKPFDKAILLQKLLDLGLPSRPQPNDEVA